MGDSATIEKDQRELAAQKAAFAQYPDGGTLQIGDLLRFWMEDGRIKFQTTQRDLPGGQPMVRVKVEGLSDPLAATAQWRLQNTDRLGNTLKKGVVITNQDGNLRLIRYDFDQDKPGQTWRIQFDRTGEFISIYTSGIGFHVFLSQGPAKVQLLINPGGKPSAVVNATSMLELLQEHPVEIRQYLSPILLRLTGRDFMQPGPGDVYGVFTEIPASASVAKAVADLLGQMDADAPDRRETASAELGKLGAPGVLAVLRLDRSKLSQEQKTRCEQFVRTAKTRDFDDPADALRDVNFLLDAMNNPDILVRQAARKALEKLCGHPLDIDVSPPVDTVSRLAALDKLRNEYAARKPATSPATRPQ